jgi:outer membrane protein OmpA-like peptidoglycan-associated protein
MGRRGAILVLAALLAAGCATKAGPQPQPGVGASPTPTPTPAPKPVPFTDKELARELRRQTGQAAATGQSGSAVATGQTPASKGDLPEIRETPRGVVVTLPHTYFAFDSFDLDALARRIVERIAYVLNHPRAAARTVALEGHADAIGTEEYNLLLSSRRAETVARELIGQGVRRERITVQAYGESRPVAPNRNRDGTDNPSGRAKNRRVEAVIRN